RRIMIPESYMILNSLFNHRLLTKAAFAMFATLATFSQRSAAQTPPLTPDIPRKFETPTSSYDYVKRDVMIPMRDAVKLHTVIVIPKGARNAPIIPMVDGWMGDDWFHFGAFRQVNNDYFTEQTTVNGKGASIVRKGFDDYENFLRAGSANDFARAAGLEQLPWWRKNVEHPAYDAFWQAQALDKV